MNREEIKQLFIDDLTIELETKHYGDSYWEP